MLLKRLASRLPRAAQQALRAGKYGLQLRAGRFRSDEPEYHQLSAFVRPGDWVLDIGANVGVYTLRLSELVGEDGRVIAFEPIPETVEILAMMIQRARFRNITLLNVAASEQAGLVRFRVPVKAGVPNYSQARACGDGDRETLGVALDELPFHQRIALVKIDVEQHEVSVIRGMKKLIEQHLPILIIEGHEGIHREFLASYGYEMRARAAGSPNLVFLPPSNA